MMRETWKLHIYDKIKTPNPPHLTNFLCIWDTPKIVLFLFPSHADKLVFTTDPKRLYGHGTDILYIAVAIRMIQETSLG